MPSNAMAAVASSGVRNCKEDKNESHIGEIRSRTYLYEGVALLVVELYGHHGITSRSGREALFSHLLVEKVCQVLLVARQLHIADVESLALSHRVSHACHRSSEACSVAWETRVAEHGRDGLTIRTGSRELA